MNKHFRGTDTHYLFELRKLHTISIVFITVIFTSLTALHAKADDYSLYRDYLLNHDVRDYICSSNLYPDSRGQYLGMDEKIITDAYFADFDGDGEYELCLVGPAASGNQYLSILNNNNGQIECVVNEWGTVWGYYYPSETFIHWMIILEGNGMDGDSHFQLTGYDENWDRQVFLDEQVTGENVSYYDGMNEHYLDREKYDRVRTSIWEDCAPVIPQIEMSYEGTSSIGDVCTWLNALSDSSDDFDSNDYGEDTWFYISSTFEKGIALHPYPDPDSAILDRMPYLTVFHGNEFLGTYVLTEYNGQKGWVNTKYAEEIILPEGISGSYPIEEWYQITSTYAEGIALHPVPVKESDILGRITYGEVFYVTSRCDNYGFTFYNGMAGWINLDYAEYYTGNVSASVNDYHENGYQDSSQEASNYELVTFQGSWNQAYDECNSRGGHLFRAETREEMLKLQELLDSGGYSNYRLYIGALRDLYHQDYYWIGSDARIDIPLNTSASWCSNFWAAGEPSYEDVNLNETETVVELYYSKTEKRWVLNDVPDNLQLYTHLSDKQLAYICEYEGNASTDIVYPDTAKIDYLTIYGHILENGFDPSNELGEFREFALFDIDKDGVKELIAETYYNRMVVIYTIVGGTAQELLEYSGMVHGENGSYVQYNEDYQAIILYNHGGTGMGGHDMYIKDGTSMSKIKGIETWSIVTETTYIGQAYSVDGTEVSENQYNSEYETYYGNSLKIFLSENNPENRNKLLC